MTSRSSSPPKALRRRPSSTFRLSVLGNHLAAPPPPDAEDEPRRQERKSSRHSIRIETGGNVALNARLETEGKPRPISITSSDFDPYYFSLSSPNQSRRASLELDGIPPEPVQQHQSTVEERNRLSMTRTSLLIPDTLASDPGSINRRALVGVGELAAPRWTVTRDARGVVHGRQEQDDRHRPSRHTPDEEVPDSPWTVEAGDASDGRLLSTKFPRSGFATSSRTSLSSSVSTNTRQDPPQSAMVESPNVPYRSVKPKMSMTEESGGEEILYKSLPRKTTDRPPISSISSKSRVYDREGTGSSVEIVPSLVDASASTVSALLPPPSACHQKPFSKARGRTSDEFAMDQSGTLISKTTGSSITNSGVFNGPTERDRERDGKVARRHRSLGVGVLGKPSDRTPGKGDSVALNLSSGKSPSTSATPRALGDKHNRQTLASSTSPFHEITHSRRYDLSHLPPSPSTSSIHHFMKHGTAPAPNTPPILSHQSSPAVAHSLLRGTREGWAALEDSSTAEALRKLDGLPGKSVRVRNSIGSGSRPNTPGNITATVSRKPSTGDGPPGTRVSMGPPTPKRSSAPFTGTPPTGSRDSASLSTATGVTSTFLSRRKLRRNSGDSDASSGHAIAEAVRLAKEDAISGEIPPVPPLLSGAYRTPSMSTGIAFPTVASSNLGPTPNAEAEDDSDDPDRTVIFPSMTATSPISPPAPTRRPTRKWSFSDALNLRLPSSSESPKDSHVGGGKPKTPGKDKEHWTAQHHQGTPGKDRRHSHKDSDTPQKEAYSQHSISQSNQGSIGSGDKSDANKLAEEKEKKKKEDKERSESRISALMGRKRGKTISSADAKRGSKPMNLPPMQISNLPASTVQRVANLKSSSSPSSVARSNVASSNRASSPARTMSKSSDASLYSSRQHLPTIAGSSFVSTGSQHSRDKEREGPSALSNVMVKETPAEIPRSRRTSLDLTGLSAAQQESAGEKDRRKKEDKERSESRISALMGRKRGKTISSADAKRGSKPMNLPPMQISNLPASTVQRVANLKASSSPPSVARSTIASRPNLPGAEDLYLRQGISVFPGPGSITATERDGELTADDSEPTRANDKPTNATISTSMTCSEIIALLESRGCTDLTSHLDTQACSEFPVSNGGFGDVYSGLLQDGTKVAIKIVRQYNPHSAAEGKYQKYAAKEIYAWSKCKHPNVARLMGLAKFRDRLAMISTWAEHGPLPGYIARNKSVDRGWLSTSVCEGLAYLHDNGIVHGDLKGANVLVLGNGTPVLIDFGNTNIADPSMRFTTTASQASFSLRWAAPEIINASSPVSCPGDIYALGMTILETITGAVPFNLKIRCS